MSEERPVEAQAEGHYFDNADIGEGTLIEPDVHVGFRYHKDCG